MDAAAWPAACAGSLQLFQPPISAASSPSPSLPSASMVLRMERRPSSSCSRPVMIGRVGGQFAVAQQAEQVFAGVGQLLQPLEAQKSRGSLDGVHRAEDLAEQSRHPAAALPGRSGTAPCGPALPGSRSGTLSSIHPLRPLIRPAGIETPGTASTQGLYRRDGAQLEKGRAEGIGNQGSREYGKPASDVQKRRKCFSLKIQAAGEMGDTMDTQTNEAGLDEPARTGAAGRATTRTRRTRISAWARRCG